MTDDPLVVEAEAWFASRGFRLVVRPDATHRDFSADLLSGDGRRSLQPRYGSGDTRGAAAARARERYEQEQ